MVGWQSLADCTGLENRRARNGSRGFKSLPHRWTFCPEKILGQIFTLAGFRRSPLLTPLNSGLLLNLISI